ncbi:MAG: hypothetical protein ACOYXA_00920 [Bacteroidota bacterium]
MKWSLVLLIATWTLLLGSCREVSFAVTQPSGVQPLREVPAELQGAYLARDPHTKEKGDTLLIESWGYHFKDAEDKDWLGRGVISDSMVVKFYKDYYFVNFKVEDQWVLRLIKKLPDGGLQFQSIDLQGEEKSKTIVKRLSKKLAVKEIKRKDDTFYQINPTPAQLIGLIEEGFFTGIQLERLGHPKK